MNTGWPWLDQGMIDDLEGKPYRDGPALKKGDRVGVEIDGEVHCGVVDDSVTDIATGVTTTTMVGDDL